MEHMFKIIGKTYVAVVIFKILLGLGLAVTWQTARNHADKTNDDLSVVELDYHMGAIKEANQAIKDAKEKSKMAGKNFAEGVSNVLRRMVQS